MPDFYSVSDFKFFHNCVKCYWQNHFEDKKSDVFTRQQAEQTLKKYSHINSFNYKNIEILINNETENVHQAQKSLETEKEKLKESAEIFSMAEKVFGGTYVQSLVGAERERRESEFIPNGLKKAW